MDLDARRPKVAHALMALTLAAYFARPLSCVVTIRQFTTEDPVPYSRFDYHGFVALFACLIALLFAGPMIWLARRALYPSIKKLALFGQGRDIKETAFSVAVALALGAPMLPQIAYLVELPLRVAAPVLVSSVAWIIVVEAIRTAAVSKRMTRGEIRVSVALALFATMPKLVWVALL